MEREQVDLAEAAEREGDGVSFFALNVGRRRRSRFGWLGLRVEPSLGALARWRRRRQVQAAAHLDGKAQHCVERGGGLLLGRREHHLLPHSSSGHGGGWQGQGWRQGQSWGWAVVTLPALQLAS